MRIVRCQIRKADAWLSAPDQNAPGRFGLYRMIYALFYIWYLASQQSSMISALPRLYFDNRILIMRAFPTPPSVGLMQALESVLAGLLVLLFFGILTRTVTVFVILVGLVLEGYLTMVDIEQGNILLVFFIPCFMLLAGNWGAAHSVDRLLRERSGSPRIDADSAGSSLMASRLLLVLISIQFVLAALYKISGTWLTHPRMLGNLMLSNSLDAAYYGRFVNPCAKLIADTPALGVGFQWFALLFELCFFVCLLGPRRRVAVLSAALIFHSLNAFLLLVTFTTILIVYPAFMDWEAFYERRRLGRYLGPVCALPTALLILITAGCAVVFSLTWNSPLSPRGVLTLGGLLDFQTIWLPVPLIAIFWFWTSLKPFRLRHRSVNPAAPA